MGRERKWIDKKDSQNIIYLIVINDNNSYHNIQKGSMDRKRDRYIKKEMLDRYIAIKRHQIDKRAIYR